VWIVVVLAFLLGDVAIAQSAPSSLADLIAAIPDGGTLELSGHYVVEETVEIFGRRDLTIQGDGTAVVLQRGGDGDKVFLVTGGSDITFRGFEIVGANPDAGNNGQAYSRRKAWVRG
jgi:hypothetical protein